ncbi:hypothetical protein Vadar_015528 [Vaccinium darrowii]|uniref:Uncharacterized protein n=1 Tax=Vaccinium darrowii TaxID=229202 RepID=A0ACB7Z3V8_9ERIC|nr:hypothetical protein Vadar_015528 [Vaccinium darrowii]
MEATNVGGGGGDRATDIVKKPKNQVSELGKYNQNLTDECLAKLAYVCPRLEVLDVSSCKGITGQGTADFLKSCSMIRKLRIVECRGIKNIRNGFELSEEKLPNDIQLVLQKRLKSKYKELDVAQAIWTKTQPVVGPGPKRPLEVATLLPDVVPTKHYIKHTDFIRDPQLLNPPAYD